MTRHTTTRTYQIELRSAAFRTRAMGIVFLFVVALLPAQEFTWGVTLDGTGSARFADHLEENDIGLSHTTALWLQTLYRVDEDAFVEFDVQPSYTWTDDRPYLFDLDRAEIEMTFASIGGSSVVIRNRLGRFPVADAGGKILNHTVDGMFADISTPLLRIRLGGAYTGFLLNPVSGIRMTGADDADSGDEELFFGPQRFVGVSEIVAPGLLLRQNAMLAVIVQRDFRTADADAEEDTLNSIYYGLRIDGPIVQGLFQDVGFYLSPSVRDTGDEKDHELGMLASARLRYFRPDWNSSRISLEGVLVSGAGDSEHNFYTISSANAGIIADIPLENIAYGELSYGLRPFAGAARRTLRDVQTTVSGRALFRVSTDQPLDSFSANTTDDGRYVGTEAALQLGWRATSDIGASVTSGAFFPGTGSDGTFTKDRKSEYLFRAQVSVSF